MKEGLLEKIQGAGHWRILIRPITPLDEKLSIARCREAVSKANVELRGWDYPHVLFRNDESGGYSNADGYFEHWTDWLSHIEFWRMFQSGQFLHYRGMWEEWDEFNNMPAKPFLSIEGAIYLFTEVAEFAARLTGYADMKDGVSISIGAHQTAGRRLWVGRNRIQFWEPKETAAASISIVKNLTTDGSTSPAQISLEMIKEFFDRFGWNPEDDQVRRDQDRLLKRQL